MGKERVMTWDRGRIDSFGPIEQRVRACPI